MFVIKAQRKVETTEFIYWTGKNWSKNSEKALRFTNHQEASKVLLDVPYLKLFGIQVLSLSY